MLGLIFRRSLVQLLGRVRKLRWGEKEAELAELAEVTREIEEAVNEAVKPLPADTEESDRQSRKRIERLLQYAAEYGFHIGRFTNASSFPKTRLEWNEDQPRLVPDVDAIGDILHYPTAEISLGRAIDEEIRNHRVYLGRARIRG
jgi:hypothetical protein